MNCIWINVCIWQLQYFLNRTVPSQCYLPNSEHTKNAREKAAPNKWLSYNDFVKLGKALNILLNIEYVMGLLISCVGFCRLKPVNIFWTIKALTVLWYPCNCKKKLRPAKCDLAVEYLKFLAKRHAKIFINWSTVGGQLCCKLNCARNNWKAWTAFSYAFVVLVDKLDWTNFSTWSTKVGKIL